MSSCGGENAGGGGCTGKTRSWLFGTGCKAFRWRVNPDIVENPAWHVLVVPLLQMYIRGRWFRRGIRELQKKKQLNSPGLSKQELEHDELYLYVGLLFLNLQ